MLPLIPTLALGFLSFGSSAFVILRIVIPILPPHPLSRRVPPSEFGLPNFRSLSPADKSHIWLATLDILALAIFIWQAVMENLGSPSGYNVVDDPLSAVRLWLATTLRQSCLLIVAALTLAHVRMGHPVSFGSKQWMLWSPTLLLVVTSTTLAGVLAGSGVETFYWGLVGYSGSAAVLSTVAFACLIGTLVIIKRNLATLNDIRDPWPSAAAETKRRRVSFATEDVEMLKEGSSWITSRAGSKHDSVSAWSFNTHRTGHTHMPSNASSRLQVNPAIGSHASIPHKSSFWFNPVTGRESPVPPVPPLPAPYRPSSPGPFNVHDDPDPFRRDDSCSRTGSQSSWLTEPSGYQPTLSAWSFPTTRAESVMHYQYPSTPELPHTQLLQAENLASTAVSRSPTPIITGTDVLGGYGYSIEAAKAEKGTTEASQSVNDIDVSVYRAVGWLVTIWVPLVLALPHYFTVHKGQPTSPATSMLLVLSVTMSAPLLACNILFRSPLPIPSGLFDAPADPPSVVMRAPSPLSTVPSLVPSYKRSGSITVVEGRRSGDVWILNGDAVEGKGKLGRAMGLLHAKPKLAVLPPGNIYANGLDKHGELTTPALPVRSTVSVAAPFSPQSPDTAEFGIHDDGEMGMRKKDSKASSYWSEVDEGMTFAAKVMVAQKHYSTLATTMILPPSPTGRVSQDGVFASGIDAVQSGAVKPVGSSHVRNRSTSSTVPGSRSGISPPPASPLPPTPPTLKNMKATINASMNRGHRRSYSSINEFSFGAIDNTKEIDALSAGVLPLLVPGLKVGSEIKITEDWRAAPKFNRRGSADGKTRKSRVPSELGGMLSELSSPEFHSTPLYARKASTQAKTRKTSTHKRQHLSLPSLKLYKDGQHSLTSWSQDLSRTFDSEADQYTVIPDITVANGMHGRPGTIYKGATGTQAVHLKAVREEDGSLRLALPPRPYSALSAAGFADSLDVPQSVNSSLVTLISALDQELKASVPPLLSATSDVTLFDFDPSADGLGESTPCDPQKTGGRRSTEEREGDFARSVRSKAPSRTKAARRSSIVYIKSDEDTAPIIQTTTTTTTTTTRQRSPTTGIVEWSRVLPKKTSKLHLRASKYVNDESDDGSEAERVGGLRQLSLLQDRNTNAVGLGTTKPLTIIKKKKTVQDENAPEPSMKRESSFKKGLKPLKLNRNETTKQRAMLRQKEVLPALVVRPPSDGHQLGAAFSFR